MVGLPIFTSQHLKATNEKLCSCIVVTALNNPKLLYQCTYSFSTALDVAIQTQGIPLLQEPFQHLLASIDNSHMQWAIAILEKKINVIDMTLTA